MGQWMRLVIMLGGVMIAGLLHAASLPGQFSNELDASDYDCILTLEPSTDLADKSAVHLTLEWDKGRPFTRVTIQHGRLVVETTTNGGTKIVAQMDSEVQPGKTYQLTVMRRGAIMGIMHENRLIGHGELPRNGGTQAGIVADPGWTIKESRIQRLEPVVFSDDFMRTVGDHSPWTLVSGNWHLKTAWDNIPHGMIIEDPTTHVKKSAFETPDQAQNPFAWVGGSSNGQPAICITGQPFWEDYTYSVSVNPGKGSACGILVNNTPTGKDNIYTALLVRWTPANSNDQGGNRLVLYNYKYTYDEKTHAASGFTLTELASSPGGFVPGQWYRFAVITSLEGVRVIVDGRERITQKNVASWRGSIGLYTEGNAGTIFDDVAVYGRTLNTDLLYETKQLHLAQKFFTDKGGMQVWSIRPDNWTLDGSVNTFHWFSKELYGNYSWVAMTVAPAANATGELWMTLNADGANTKSGYRAVLQTGGTPVKLTYILYRNETELAKKTVAPLAAGTDYSLHFWRVENKVWLEVDGDTVITATDQEPLTGCHAAYRNDGGAFSKVTDLQVLGHNTLEYTFSDAPTDWLSEGTWEPSIRWSCTPNWSFLAGWSRGNAVLWHKQRLHGDQSIEAYVGTKMDYPRETETYYVRQGYFAVSLCSDGQDPRSGYAGVYGYPDDNGNPVKRAVLLRNGEVVKDMWITPRHWATNHHSWFHLRLTKHGNTIDFTATVDAEVYSLSYTETKPPMDEGIPAVWTFNNAMPVARVRLDYANPPTPRTDPQVVIANPWYPEWANQGMPLALDLSESWSVTGKPVSWKVTPAEVPAGDEGSVQVSDGKLRFTAKQPGKHWYKIAAVDGTSKSPDFHLSLKVFNPALKRDDTHALVLYRFDEGKGNIVHDRGVAAPALDLTIPPDPNGNFKWLPGQGVESRCAGAMKSTVAADKLLKIKETKACTLEVWQSASTLFGPYRRSGCFFTWEPAPPEDGIRPSKDLLAEGIPNLAFYFSQDYISVANGGIAIQANAKPVWFAGMLTSLHHLTITWDGNATTCYLDGVQLSDAVTLPWNIDKWVKGAPLMVGNQTNNFRGYPGSLYLLAIHDRCFTADEVKRQYNAGPSAR